MPLSNANKLKIMQEWGVHVRDRDPRLNTNYAGQFMVVEGSMQEIEEDYQLPTEDGSNGPWCVVGDDMQDLIDVGYIYISSLDPPGFKARLRELEGEDDNRS